MPRGETSLHFPVPFIASCPTPSVFHLLNHVTFTTWRCRCSSKGAFLSNYFRSGAAGPCGGEMGPLPLKELTSARTGALTDDLRGRQISESLPSVRPVEPEVGGEVF